MDASSIPNKFPGVTERLKIWMIEISIQAFVFCLLLIWIGHEDRPIGLSDIFVGCYAVLYIFGLSGYLVTTPIARVFLMRQNPWLSSGQAVALFLIHLEVLNRLILPLGVGAPRDRTIIRLAGVGITSLTAIVGTVELRRKRKTKKFIQSIFQS